MQTLDWVAELPNAHADLTQPLCPLALIFSSCVVTVWVTSEERLRLLALAPPPPKY